MSAAEYRHLGSGFFDIVVRSLVSLEEVLYQAHVNYPSLTNYVKSAAWPVILDEYVEWMSKRKKQQ